MTEETPEEWGMSAEEIVEMYAEFGMLETVTPGNSGMVELNGEPNHGHIIAVVYWNADYTFDYKIFGFTSGLVVPDAPQADIDAKVQNITAETADLVFTPGEWTCGYFYRLFTKEEYESTREEGQMLGEDPDKHVRDQVAAGGSMNWKDYTDSRSALSSKTEYVLVCYPFNVNGTQGWGESTIVPFTTL